MTTPGQVTPEMVSRGVRAYYEIQDPRGVHHPPARHLVEYILRAVLGASDEQVTA